MRSGAILKGYEYEIIGKSSDLTFLASECDFFIGFDTITEQLTKGQQRQSLPRRYPSSKSF